MIAALMLHLLSHSSATRKDRSRLIQLQWFGNLKLLRSEGTGV